MAGALPSLGTYQVVERIGKCNKALVENALLVATDEKIAKETDVARDDIREVRVSSGRREAASTLLGDTSDNVDKVSAHWQLYGRRLFLVPLIWLGYCRYHVCGCVKKEPRIEPTLQRVAGVHCPIYCQVEMSARLTIWLATTSYFARYQLTPSHLDLFAHKCLFLTNKTIE